MGGVQSHADNPEAPGLRPDPKVLGHLGHLSNLACHGGNHRPWLVRGTSQRAPAIGDRLWAYHAPVCVFVRHVAGATGATCTPHGVHVPRARLATSRCATRCTAGGNGGNVQPSEQANAPLQHQTATRRGLQPQRRGSLHGHPMAIRVFSFRPTFRGREWATARDRTQATIEDRNTGAPPSLLAFGFVRGHP